MQPNLKDELSHPLQSQEPIIEILDDLVPAPLHAAAWATCMGSTWRFGHGSRGGGSARFWRMELENDSAFGEIWRRAQPRCEALAGVPLKVLSQYANGHTYGLGGEPHIDTSAPGSFTLLYYPNPVWENGWDGETVFYDNNGEVAFAVRPRPNRALFFDARVLHNGRAPSRFCTELRVTVAYKLQAVPSSSLTVVGMRSESDARQPDADPPQQCAPSPSAARGEIREISRNGATRAYSGHVPDSAIEREMEQRLDKLAETVRLPGFRRGKAPAEELRRRYGATVRAESLKRFAADMVERGLPAGSVAGACELKSGADSGDMEVLIHATHLPDLPDPDFSSVAIERLSCAEENPDISAFLRKHLKTQVLDRLDSLYSIPLFRGIVERELTAILAASKSQPEFPATAEEQKALAAELAPVAERRLRLGLVVSELARRYGIRAAHAMELEENVVDCLLANAKIVDRNVTAKELRSLMDE